MWYSRAVETPPLFVGSGNPGDEAASVNGLFNLRNRQLMATKRHKRHKQKRSIETIVTHRAKGSVSTDFYFSCAFRAFSRLSFYHVQRNSSGSRPPVRTWWIRASLVICPSSFGFPQPPTPRTG